MEELRNNEVLQPSLGDDITDQLLEQLLDTKQLIDKWKSEGYTTALVHLSGDMMHSSHIQYMNTIRAKINQRLGIPDEKIKLAVGLEADSRTLQRKQKQNINTQEERVMNFGNLKAVDHSFIEFEGVTGPMENEQKPAGIVQYLNADLMIGHEEHINSLSEYIRISRVLYPNKLLNINYGDIPKYLGEEETREKYQRSTTNTIRQIFDLYRGNDKYDR